MTNFLIISLLLDLCILLVPPITNYVNISGLLVIHCHGLYNLYKGGEMRTPTRYSIGKAGKEVYRQALLNIFKCVVFTLALASWLIGLLKKCTR